MTRRQKKQRIATIQAFALLCVTAFLFIGFGYLTDGIPGAAFAGLISFMAGLLIWGHN